MMKEKKLPPIHPGEILMEEFLKPMELSQYRLAKDIGVTPIRIDFGRDDQPIGRSGLPRTAIPMHRICKPSQTD